MRNLLGASPPFPVHFFFFSVISSPGFDRGNKRQTVSGLLPVGMRCHPRLLLPLLLAGLHCAHASSLPALRRLRGGSSAAAVAAAAAASPPAAKAAEAATTPEWAEGKLAQKETLSFKEALPWLEHVRRHGAHSHPSRCPPPPAITAADHRRSRFPTQPPIAAADLRTQERIVRARAHACAAAACARFGP